MKNSSEGFRRCCNAEPAVDGKNQMIVATAAAWTATDQAQLVPVPDAAAATVGRMPGEVPADAGH